MVLSHTAHQTVEYLRVAPAAIWILDYFLTFEHEVRLFSNMSCWNIVTVMFILARYAPVIWIITEIYLTLSPYSAETCVTLNPASATSLFFIMSAAEGLLLVRILALWHNSRKMKLFLLASYLLIVVAMVICDILLAVLLESICTPASIPMVSDLATMEHLIMGKFVSAALFELIVITLTMYHSIRLRSDGIRSISRVASTLLKGSLLYALSLLAISIINIVSFALPASSQEKDGIIDVFQGVLHGVLASRVLFDLRDLMDTGQDEEHDYLFTSYISLPRTQRVSQMIPMTVLHAESNA
ncbi:uncharacterized protein F5891DRAFT_1053376 [Suillus fuscotomentosus]|uniref:DUF6533 domain-containing protein n=1 Tax=Suillus fuscotomentosus TaxID=1912939 RepID=A0AAD4DYR2_9AGAM|nr:uncharacterized protein F5891DRAFT_1053376 [Suillus fuscotomentosus]KAG1896586.1 hypothetical protein F5891DRAFT_1053376 [Suillus fuscotomentosus]